jgi:hypothetical protein
MKSAVQLETATQSLLIALALLCVAPLPRAQAVSPAPDGCYPNFTTGNTAVGWRSLFLNTTGNVNTAIGESALYANTEGGSNTAIGESALANNGSAITTLLWALAPA